MIEKLSDVIYVLRKPRGRKLYTLHYDCLKPFVARDPALIQNHSPETLEAAPDPLQQPVQFVSGTSSSEDDVVPERRAIPVEDDGVSSNSETSSSNEAEPVRPVADPVPHQRPQRLRSRPTWLNDYCIDTDSD